jgi:hypothetical protein
MACVESMAFALHGKLKDSKVRRVVHDRLHMVIFMSIKPLMISKHMGRRWWWRVLITYNLVLLEQNIFGLVIANLVSKRFPFQVWHN